MSIYPTADLNLAERHVALAAQHVTQQEELLSSFRRKGFRTDEAEDLMARMLSTLRRQQQHRDEISAHLSVTAD
jgi:type II secretory pathway predicted ATPase ExeA